MRYLVTVIFLVVNAIGAAAVASEAAKSEPKFWSTDVELGAVFTSGNTDQESVNLRVDSKRSGEKWDHKFRADTLQASQDGDDTADKFYVFYRLDRKLDEKSSIFTRLAYEDDKFSGFENQQDLTVGYSRVLVDRDNLRIDGDAGIGAKRSELDDGETSTETLIRLAADLNWQISESAKFVQSLGFEIGEDLTTIRSESAVETTITQALAMKLAYKLKRSSEVLPGKKNTDTETTVSLVYHF